MSSDVVDCRGLELQVGDTVAYPVASGSSSAQIVVGQVIKVTLPKSNPNSYTKVSPSRVTVRRKFNSRYGVERGEDQKSSVTAVFTMKIQLPYTIQEAP